MSGFIPRWRSFKDDDAHSRSKVMGVNLFPPLDVAAAYVFRVSRRTADFTASFHPSSSPDNWRTLRRRNHSRLLQLVNKFPPRSYQCRGQDDETWNLQGGGPRSTRTTQLLRRDQSLTGLTTAPWRGVLAWRSGTRVNNEERRRCLAEQIKWNRHSRIILSQICGYCADVGTTE